MAYTGAPGDGLTGRGKASKVRPRTKPAKPSTNKSKTTTKAKRKK